MDSIFDALLARSLTGGGGGGGGGTTNYNSLENKPQINGTTLTGNKSLSDLGIAAASAIPTVNNGTLTIQKNSTTINTFKANQSSDVTINISVPTTAADVSALPSSTKYASSLSLTINSSTYVVTGQLKDQDGNNLGNAQTIDLPLETMVVGGSYDDTNKKIVLTLKNGETIDIPVADLVSGLQTELSATNKLDPAYINYDSTHAAVTESDKTTWSGKQDSLTFNGTYDASTNPAATVSTVTNAINDLDVTGDSGISASKTISAWSESNGEVSISTQDIDIASSQVTTMTSYAKAQSGSAIATTDTLNEAVGKLEYKADTDTAALVDIIDSGAKNHLTQTDFSGTAQVEIPIKIPAGTYVIYRSNLTTDDTDATSCLCRFYDDSGGTNVQRASVGLARGGDRATTIEVSGDTTFMRIYASDSAAHSTGDTISGTNFMVCAQSAWNISQTFQPYCPSNQELYKMILNL